MTKVPGRIWAGGMVDWDVVICLVVVVVMISVVVLHITVILIIVIIRSQMPLISFRKAQDSI